MFSLSAFRSLQISSVASVGAIRTMAVKAAVSKTAASKTATKKKTDSAKSTKATKATKTTKATKAEKTEKAPKVKKADAPKSKPKKIEPLPMPKRPNTSWTLFYMEHLDNVKASGKSIVPTAETAAASALWKQLSAEEKQVYEDKYRADFERFKKETEERLQQLTPAEFKLENSRRQALRATGKKGLPSLKDPNAPKRPLSGFFRFAQDLRKSGEYANMPVNEQAKAFAEAWSKASDSVKTPYNQASHAALQKYKEEKAVYDDQK